MAQDLLNGTGGGAADDPPRHVLETMLSLARDPDPTVRGVATAKLVYSAIDAPALRKLFTSQLDSDDRQVQIQAATGLALRDDAHAMAELRRMSDEDGYESFAWKQVDVVERLLTQPTRT